MTKESTEFMDMLVGCEISAPELYEDIVGISKNRANGTYNIIEMGQVVDVIETDQQVRKLMFAVDLGELY